MKTKIVSLLSVLVTLMTLNYGCKKEVYPEQLDFLVLDANTNQPIPKAQVFLTVTWRHPYKIANNNAGKEWALFPDYGRKLVYFPLIDSTDESGRVSFKQKEEGKFMTVVPYASAANYELTSFDTLDMVPRSQKKRAEFVLRILPKIETTFIIKWKNEPSDIDSVRFSACNHVVMLKRNMSEISFMAYVPRNSDDGTNESWWGQRVYYNGTSKTVCGSVISSPGNQNMHVFSF